MNEAVTKEKVRVEKERRDRKVVYIPMQGLSKVSYVQQVREDCIAGERGLHLK